jgi:hypothetical protein
VQPQEVARAAEKRGSGGAREENDRVQSVTLHAESRLVVAVLHGRDDERQDRNEIEVLLNSVRATGMGLSAGAVRGAARASVLLASARAWRQLGPLPVQGRRERRGRVRGNDAVDAAAKHGEAAMTNLPDKTQGSRS